MSKLTESMIIQEGTTFIGYVVKYVGVEVDIYQNGIVLVKGAACVACLECMTVSLNNKREEIKGESQSGTGEESL